MHAVDYKRTECPSEIRVQSWKLQSTNNWLPTTKSGENSPLGPERISCYLVNYPLY